MNITDKMRRLYEKCMNSLESNDWERAFFFMVKHKSAEMKNTAPKWFDEVKAL